MKQSTLEVPPKWLVDVCVPRSVAPNSFLRNSDDENEEAFLRLIMRYPLATCLFVKYCQENDLAMLKRVYRAFGR